MKISFLLITITADGKEIAYQDKDWQGLLTRAFHTDGTGEIIAWQLQMLVETGRNRDGEIEGLANPIAQSPSWGDME